MINLSLIEEIFSYQMVLIHTGRKEHKNIMLICNTTIDMQCNPPILLNWISA